MAIVIHWGSFFSFFASRTAIRLEPTVIPPPIARAAIPTTYPAGMGGLGYSSEFIKTIEAKTPTIPTASNKPPMDWTIYYYSLCYLYSDFLHMILYN
jgi:hypothetical protein